MALNRPASRSTPWGFNYDHDTEGRLIEDYWESEWAKVETHFSQMKKRGANVIRIHLQFGKFTPTASFALNAPRIVNEDCFASLALPSTCVDNRLESLFEESQES